MVAKNSPIRKASDLVGKTIATDLLRRPQTHYGTKLEPAMIEASVQPAYTSGMSTGTVPVSELIATGFADG